MRVAFTGKGGVGKTTLASFFIRSLAKEKRRVLAVDCDPDSNLAAALGFSDASKITPISKMKDLINERMEIKDGTPIFYKLNPKMDDIPEKFLNRMDLVSLIVMGIVERGGGGCVCPASVFMRNLLSEIVLREGEDIVMDMDPGVEHLGRQTAKSVDEFIVVVEPSLKSVETAKKIEKLSKDIDVKNTFIIGNKIKNEKDKNFIRSNFNQSQILGLVPLSDAILEVDKSKDVNIIDKTVVGEVEKVKKYLISKEDKYARK